MLGQRPGYNALFVAAALLCASPENADAQGLGKEDCRATRSIVAIAVAARKAGREPAAIKATLSEGPEAVAPVYVPTVGPLVDWVFGVDRAALTSRLAEEFEAQCLRYEE